jgi:alpha-L-rhamnosidase
MFIKTFFNHKVYTLFVLALLISLQPGFGQDSGSNNKKWFPLYDFDASRFKNPACEFSPFARWWWPGNDVTKEELKREVNLFSDNAFGGLEIQPLNLFVPASSPEAKSRVLSWDTPEYYENVRTVLEEARKRGIIIDMTDGSGWPPGGPYLLPEDGFINLLFASKDIKGGEEIQIPVPKISNNTGVASKLEAVLATKVIQNNPDDKSKTVLLDPSSTLILTSYVKNDTLNWNAPAEDRKIIAFWSRPNSLTGSMAATVKQGPVMNHFDSVKVIKNYTHLFGSRTGLQPYFGNPLRAVFNDSYEFAVDRHFSNDFIAYFKEKRGYDITPWLPANMQKGYNYASWMNPNAPPDFSYGSEDWRLRYDYDMTLSELFSEHFIRTSTKWLEKQGLLHRAQSYGLNMDLIGNAGLASIPETETMVGPEAILKVMASGAHLYNRPILSAESIVFSNRAYMTTPQKIRMVADKLFAAGVNQIIYHGIPYRYLTDDTKPVGWYPFGSSFANFSSNLGEANIFWKYQKEVNEYVSRTQYALRSGKPHFDVLIYFPFMNVEGMPDNIGEILTKGYIEGVEPPLPKGAEAPAKDKSAWAEKIYPVINLLESNGITWEWVNDASIQQASLDGKQVNIRGNLYQAIILVDISTIQLKTAESIAELAKNGMKLLVTGSLPVRQPSFLNWEANDKITNQLIEEAVKQRNSVHIQDINQLNRWLLKLSRTIKFRSNYNFTRQIEREMADGSRIQFIWNKSNEWQQLSLALDKKYKNSGWLNAETGSIYSVDDLNHVQFNLPPYSSIILFAGTKTNIPDNLRNKPSPTVYKAKEVLSINKWDIQSGTTIVKDTSLFDWKENARFKYSSNEGIYKSSFVLDKIDPGITYLIDLGKVCFTAEVLINDKQAGHRIFGPYSLDITNYIKTGKNTIEIRVTPSQLNYFIGEAALGNKNFNAFKGKQNDLMSDGLIGPVNILKQ